MATRWPHFYINSQDTAATVSFYNLTDKYLWSQTKTFRWDGRLLLIRNCLTVTVIGIPLILRSLIKAHLEMPSH